MRVSSPSGHWLDQSATVAAPGDGGMGRVEGREGDRWEGGGVPDPNRHSSSVNNLPFVNVCPTYFV